jgi:hypothetical protein
MKTPIATAETAAKGERTGADAVLAGMRRFARRMVEERKQRSDGHGGER